MTFFYQSSFLKFVCPIILLCSNYVLFPYILDKTRGKASDSINQFLVELDGFTGREGIIVIGATNVPQKLDKALIRFVQIQYVIERSISS